MRSGACSRSSSRRTRDPAARLSGPHRAAARGRCRRGDLQRLPEPRDEPLVENTRCQGCELSVYSESTALGENCGGSPPCDDARCSFYWRLKYRTQQSSPGARCETMRWIWTQELPEASPSSLEATGAAGTELKRVRWRRECGAWERYRGRVEFDVSTSICFEEDGDGDPKNDRRRGVDDDITIGCTECSAPSGGVDAAAGALR